MAGRKLRYLIRNDRASAANQSHMDRGAINECHLDYLRIVDTPFYVRDGCNYDMGFDSLYETTFDSGATESVFQT